ncbi:hypothetical protein [Flaviaesturariibacter amylovorans]|uniref:Uncharacterized protein n=1 Tax=Flaviaesturariibacter amylovorans TaxID=1084520 RepID=A0ABP8HJF3_9BACT
MKKILSFALCIVLAGSAAQAQSTTYNSESTNAAFARSLQQQTAALNAKYDNIIASIQADARLSQAAKNKKIAETNRARARKLEDARVASARKEQQVIAQQRAKNGTLSSTSNNAAYAASLDRQIADLNAKYDAIVAGIQSDASLTQAQKDVKIRQTNEARAAKIRDARAASARKY